MKFSFLSPPLFDVYLVYSSGFTPSEWLFCWLQAVSVYCFVHGISNRLCRLQCAVCYYKPSHKADVSRCDHHSVQVSILIFHVCFPVCICASIFKLCNVTYTLFTLSLSSLLFYNCFYSRPGGRESICIAVRCTVFVSCISDVDSLIHCQLSACWWRSHFLPSEQ